MRLDARRAVFLLCTVALAISASSASARPVDKSRNQDKPVASQFGGPNGPNSIPYPFESEKPAHRQTAKKAHRQTAKQKRAAQPSAIFGGFSSNSLVSEARKYIGTNPTGRGSLWCGAFMDLVLKRTGHAGGGNLASAYANYGKRVSGPRVGAIAVMRRGGGGHVGVVSGIDPNGNPIIISGNHNRTTAESVYPRGRIYAYVVPGG